MIKYYYTLEDEWDEDFLNDFHSHSGNKYVVAESICEEYDNHMADYPESRSLWLLREGEINPVRIVVNAEVVRRYDAVIAE